MKQLNLTGERFGKLVAIKTIGKNKNGGYLWQCGVPSAGLGYGTGEFAGVVRGEDHHHGEA